MKPGIIKQRITNLIQKHAAVHNIVQNAAQSRETNIQKTENPALNLHRQRKTSSRDIHMFVSQMNKPIDENFPDGDVLHIESGYPDGDVLNIKDTFPDGDVLHIKRITGGIIHGEI